MGAFANNLNYLHSGLNAGINDLEKRTSHFFDGVDKKYVFFKKRYDDVIGVYSNVKNDLQVAYNTVDDICNKAEQAYVNAVKVFERGMQVVDSVFAKLRNVFYPAKKTVAPNPVPSVSVPRTSSKTIYSSSKKQTIPEVKQVKKIIPRTQVINPVSSTVVKTRKGAGSDALDDLVKDFKKKLGTINSSYDVRIDVYDNGSVIKSYAVRRNEEQGLLKQIKQEQMVQNKKTIYTKKPYLETLLMNADKKYIEDSFKISELYSKGLSTRMIMDEAARKGYQGINGFRDVADRVAVGIDAGMVYDKDNYNNAVAGRLGAREQIINDYLAGKSYKEIKNNLKQKTNGMNISDSSILRIMHQYEKKTSKKVVGKRNGNGKKKKKINNNKKNRSGAKSKDKK